MRLSPERFNAHLANLAQAVRWRRAYDCPCRDAHSGAGRYDCPQCQGRGRIWSNPVDAIAAVAGQKVQREWAQFGLYESGDMVLSIPSDTPLYAIGEFDRVVMADSSTPFSLTHTRGVDDTFRFPVIAIDRVFWLDGADAIVEGGIPTVDAAGVPTWSTGEPPAGMQYGIAGRKRPEYFVFKEFPQDRAHHGGAALPRRVVVRLFDLYGR